jgi:peptidoglycan-N-acetylglucosamine deacetylase
MSHGAGVCGVDRSDTRSFAVLNTFAARIKRRRFGGSKAFAVALLLTGCAHLPSQPRVPPAYWGFAGPWDPQSDAAIDAHGSKLDRVITGWIGFDTTSFRPVRLYPDTIGTLPAIAPRAMALITTYFGSRFHPEIIRGLGGNAQFSATTAGGLASLVDSGGYHGVVIDFEGMTPRDLDQLLRVTKAIADSVHAHGVTTVVIAVPAGDTAAYPAALLLQSADLIMPVLYDQHWATSPPGPIAAVDWVTRNLGTRVAEVGAARIVAAFPLYGYRWRRSAPAEVISYDDARRLTTTTNTPLVRDHASATLHAMSPEGWEIWVSDRVLVETLVREARELGVTSFALWRLGLEDPAVWNFIGS